MESEYREKSRYIIKASKKSYWNQNLINLVQFLFPINQWSSYKPNNMDYKKVKVY